MSSKIPPSWLVKAFSATLEPLVNNADKHTIKINQTFDNEPQRNTLQTYILHFVKDNKFSVETFFSSPIGTNPNPNTTIPFATFYDNNTAVGTKGEVAHALAFFSYNYFLSGQPLQSQDHVDSATTSSTQPTYTVTTDSFTQTQSTGTSVIVTNCSDPNVCPLRTTCYTTNGITQCCNVNDDCTGIAGNYCDNDNGFYCASGICKNNTCYNGCPSEYTYYGYTYNASSNPVCCPPSEPLGSGNCCTPINWVPTETVPCCPGTYSDPNVSGACVPNPNPN